MRGSRARRAGPSAYVTGGHAGVPARGKQGGSGGQGGWGWGVWGRLRSPIVCGCEGVTGRGGSSSSLFSTPHWGRGASQVCHTVPRCPLRVHLLPESAPRDGLRRTRDPGGRQLKKSRPSPLQQKQTHQTKPRLHQLPTSSGFSETIISS